ncbi:hypothetical protein Dda3937_04436 [Dickeya dadantii 3937]|uniref:Uncharacterized protein n=1 Tax=Dickeya dadantii (strain 3937) TaxID=198628 RepID=E0SGE4_DICD3|nr:hypothetical protein Dda3937_04436 [Dickeya dadantii 3937]
MLRILGRGASLCNKKIAQNALSLRFCTNSDAVSHYYQSFVQISVRQHVKSALRVRFSGIQTSMICRRHRHISCTKKVIMLPFVAVLSMRFGI